MSPTLSKPSIPSELDDEADDADATHQILAFSKMRLYNNEQLLLSRVFMVL